MVPSIDWQQLHTEILQAYRNGESAKAIYDKYGTRDSQAYWQWEKLGLPTNLKALAQGRAPRKSPSVKKDKAITNGNFVKFVPDGESCSHITVTYNDNIKCIVAGGDAESLQTVLNCLSAIGE